MLPLKKKDVSSNEWSGGTLHYLWLIICMPVRVIVSYTWNIITLIFSSNKNT